MFYLVYTKFGYSDKFNSKEDRDAVAKMIGDVVVVFDDSMMLPGFTMKQIGLCDVGMEARFELQSNEVVVKIIDIGYDFIFKSRMLYNGEELTEEFQSDSFEGSIAMLYNHLNNSNSVDVEIVETN